MLAFAGLLATVAPADAAVYRGRFDPVYGDPFTSPALAWGGTLKVTVDDACVQPGSLFLLSCFGGFQINEATVELYRVGDPVDGHGAPLVPRQTMDFGAAAGPGISGLNWALNFDGNADLVGANSTAFTSIKGAIDETKYNDIDQAWFSLQFLGDYAQLYWFKKKPSALELLVLTTGPESACRENGSVVIPGIPFVYGGNTCGWSDPDNITSGSFIRFERVPEPATYALVPAALGIMALVGLTTRRRRSLAS